MTDDEIIAWSIALIAIFVFGAGVLIGCAVMSDLNRQQMEKCRKAHNVYVCELMPISDPAWVKPSAENT